MKKTSKILGIIALAAVIGFSSCGDGGSGIIPDYSWYDSSGTYFEISTVEQLLGFANLVNGHDGKDKTNFNGKTVTLTDDINLNNKKWIPIVEPTGDSAGRFFYGEFDGGGKTISGLYVSSIHSNQGLFGRNHGTIRNLGVSGTVKSEGYNIGGIVGANYGTVEECWFEGSVSGDSSVGGVVGDNNSFGSEIGTIKNCYNTGTVSARVGDAGGITGSSRGLISYCYNTGNVTAGFGSGVAAGIAVSFSPEIKNCVSLGLKVTTVSEFDQVGRITTSTSSNLENNKARSDMKIGERNSEVAVDGTHNSKDGESVALGIGQATVFSGWDGLIWNISGNLNVGDNLPTLKNVAPLTQPKLP